MFGFFEEVKAVVIKDTRNAETLMIDKTRQAMSEVLANRFDSWHEKISFLSEYAHRRGYFVRFSPNQAPLWDWVADRLKTKLIAQNVFDDHFVDGVGDYKNFKERHKIGV